MSETLLATPEVPAVLAETLCHEDALEEEAFIRLVIPDVQKGASKMPKGGWVDQEDVAQEALMGILRAYRRGADFTSARSNVRGYAVVGGKNSAISAIRRQRRHVKTTPLETTWEDDARTDTSMILADPTADTERQALQALEGDRERFDALFAAAGVPEDFRKPFVLHHVDGLSYEEIAHQLDIKHGTVQSRISRALSALRLYAGITKGEKTRRRNLFDELEA